MYKQNRPQQTTLRVNNSYVGERLEQKVNRIVNNKEPIKDGAPLIYTDRKDGVRAEMNIKTDRWELAIDAMEMVAKNKLAKREARQAERDKLGMKPIVGGKKEGGEVGGAESAPGTGQ